MSSSNEVPVEAPTPPQPPAPGRTVREAREAAGLSINDVAQQLKLAPRQVQALEADDYAQLPGRTFVRGFLRNYARLLGLDSETLLAALPDGSTSSLDRPALSPTTRVMGELPADASRRTGKARWAIPLVFVALVAIAAAYLWRPGSARTSAPGAAVEQPVPATPPTRGESPSGAGAAATGVSASTAAGAPTPPLDAPTTGAAAPLPVAAQDAAPAAAGDTPLVVVFRGTSWIEVKDARGNVLLSTMGYPGATHAVGGILPFDVVVGNAEAVQVTLRGEAFDTTPYAKQNVAKFQVK